MCMRLTEYKQKYTVASDTGQCWFKEKFTFAEIVFDMAKPIKETPILTGKDAERFVSEMQRVDSLSAEQRKSNYAQLMAQYKEATRNIEICL